MRLARMLLATALFLTLSAPFASAVTSNIFREEHVTGGNLDLTWLPGFATNRVLIPNTLLPGDPAYANPSGDHTVGALVNATPDSGGIALSLTDPAGHADYTWEGWMFTGDGSTRRGLAVRFDPAAGFQNGYVFVLYAGLAQLQFRKLVGQTPTSLGSWFTFNLPGGLPAQNTWHRMKVIAQANAFRCFWDDYELTSPTTPILDTNNPFLTGDVGTYNFNFSVGGVPALFDDLVLSGDFVLPAKSTTWGHVKALYR